MLHHHGEVSNTLFDFGPIIGLLPLHRGFFSIYLISANDFLVKILQVLLMQGLREDGML
jgi:hypothetical protein